MKQVLIKGRLVSYEETGADNKPTLVVLHGWGHQGRLWLPIAHLLDDYRLVMPDLPGFGSSQALLPGSSVPQVRVWLGELLDKLEISKAVLLGHSFGGQVAMDFALTHPHRVSRLILVSPSVIRRRTLKTQFFAFIRPLVMPFVKILGEQLHSKIQSTDYAAANASQKDLLRHIVTYDLSHKMSRVKTKTLIVWGENDREIPNVSKEMAAHLPDSYLKILWGHGHNPHLEDPKVMADTIRWFLHDAEYTRL